MNDHPGWAKPFIAMYANSPIVTLILDDTLEIRWENKAAKRGGSLIRQLNWDDCLVRAKQNGLLPCLQEGNLLRWLIRFFFTLQFISSSNRKWTNLAFYRAFLSMFSKRLALLRRNGGKVCISLPIFSTTIPGASFSDFFRFEFTANGIPER